MIDDDDCAWDEDDFIEVSDDVGLVINNHSDPPDEEMWFISIADSVIPEDSVDLLGPFDAREKAVERAKRLAVALRAALDD